MRGLKGYGRDRGLGCGASKITILDSRLREVLGFLKIYIIKKEEVDKMRRVFFLIIALIFSVSSSFFFGTSVNPLLLAAEKKVTLTVVVPYNVETFLPGEDENNNEIINYLEEKSGFDLKWIILPPDQPWEKVSMMLASGDPPDIINCTDRNIFGQYLQQGVIAPIDEYLPNCPNINKLVPKEIWSAVTWKGKRYAVPIPQNQYISGTNGIFVRKDWLRELGFKKEAESKEPIPLNTYYRMLTAIKNKKKVVPFTVGSTGIITGFAGAFGIGTAYKVKGNKIVYSYVQPEAKEYLTYMNKLYKEGLLDPEFPVNKAGNIQEKLVAGRAAMAVVGWADALPIDRSFKEKNPKGELGYIAPPKGPRGWGIANHSSPLRTTLIIPAQSKNKKEAMQFLDLMTRPDIYNFVSFGIEGKHYVREKGEIKLLPEYQNRRWQIYYILVDTQEAFAVRLRDKGFKVYSDQVVPYCNLYPIDGYAPPLPEVISVAPDLNSLVTEYFIRFITGDLSLDKFDEFVSEWRAKGGEKALEALNKWYKEEYKK